jgi:hypothetical protein
MQNRGTRKLSTVIVLHGLVCDDEDLVAHARRIVACAKAVIEDRQSRKDGQIQKFQ